MSDHTSTPHDYRVQWDIDATATSPLEAARTVWKDHFRGDTVPDGACVFHVTDPHGITHVIDLGNIEAPMCPPITADTHLCDLEGIDMDVMVATIRALKGFAHHRGVCDMSDSTWRRSIAALLDNIDAEFTASAGERFINDTGAERDIDADRVDRLAGILTHDPMEVIKQKITGRTEIIVGLTAGLVWPVVDRALRDLGACGDGDLMAVRHRAERLSGMSAVPRTLRGEARAWFNDLECRA